MSTGIDVEAPGAEREREFVQLLQAHASGLVTRGQVDARLRKLFPEWFEGEE